MDNSSCFLGCSLSFWVSITKITIPMEKDLKRRTGVIPSQAEYEAVNWAVF
jgi:hypothetical protein